jgi:hypothetical protein
MTCKAHPCCLGYAGRRSHFLCNMRKASTGTSHSAQHDSKFERSLPTLLALTLPQIKQTRGCDHNLIDEPSFASTIVSQIPASKNNSDFSLASHSQPGARYICQVVRSLNCDLKLHWSPPQTALRNSGDTFTRLHKPIRCILR